MAQHWKLGLPWQGQLARGAPVSPWEMRDSRKWQARIGWSHQPPPSLKPHFRVWNRILYTQVYSLLVCEIGWHLNLQSPSLQCTWGFIMHAAQCIVLVRVTFWSLPRPGRYGMSTAQLELRWETQRGVVPVTATCTKEHAAPWRQDLWSLITRESFFGKG